MKDLDENYDTRIAALQAEARALSEDGLHSSFGPSDKDELSFLDFYNKNGDLFKPEQSSFRYFSSLRIPNNVINRQSFGGFGAGMAACGLLLVLLSLYDPFTAPNATFTDNNSEYLALFKLQEEMIDNQTLAIERLTNSLERSVSTLNSIAKSSGVNDSPVVILTKKKLEDGLITEVNASFQKKEIESEERSTVDNKLPLAKAGECYAKGIVNANSDILSKQSAESETGILNAASNVTRNADVNGIKFVWRRVLCESDVTKGIVMKLQEKLNLMGFSAGAIDGVLGSDTLFSIEAFQDSQNLATGGLTIETLEQLGIDPSM